MIKKLLLSLTAIAISSSIFAQIYVAKTCEVSFFSASPLENIEAIAKVPKTFLNISTNDVQVQITNTAFMFEKPLMQEHFNENYMESEKFPSTTFKGKINEKVDWTKDGEQKVTVTGKMSMHGVDKEITINGVVTIKGGEISISSKFKVHVADYKIKVPSLYIQNIAEDVDVKLNAVMGPIKKN
ncbi:MAG TPA: YceI family protein [Bacteroidia bacterium]|nr:YceI family protein [Bacteroidia bacterium]